MKASNKRKILLSDLFDPSVLIILLQVKCKNHIKSQKKGNAIT